MRKLEEDECPTCLGIGEVVKATPKQFGKPLPIAPRCPDCNGTGKRPKPVVERQAQPVNLGQLRRVGKFV